MACVPGGNVMANVIGWPLLLASMTKGFSALGSAWTLPLRSTFSEIDWPLRFNIQGMIIGFLGEPSRPMVEAMGIPISMCVAWMSPFDSASRMAAQLAPLLTVELMPYFLNSPFSCAMTMGEQSVRPTIPNFRSGVSGASLAQLTRVFSSAGTATAAPPILMKPRRDNRPLFPRSTMTPRLEAALLPLRFAMNNDRLNALPSHISRPISFGQGRAPTGVRGAGRCSAARVDLGAVRLVIG